MDHYRSVRSQMAGQSPDELDLVIMGAVITFDDSTFLSKERKKGYTFFSSSTMVFGSVRRRLFFFTRLDTADLKL